MDKMCLRRKRRKIWEKKGFQTVQAEEILAMITVEKRFLPGDKLPNENELSQEMEISGRHFGSGPGLGRQWYFGDSKGPGDICETGYRHG